MESKWMASHFDDILWLGYQACYQRSETEATLPLGVRWRSCTTREVFANQSEVSVLQMG